MMEKSSPLSCEDSVVETIRTSRIMRRNQTPGTASGIEMHKVWKVVRKTYSEDEFRQALRTMLSTGRIVGWYGSYCNNSGRSFKRKLTVAPGDWHATTGVVNFDYQSIGKEHLGTAQLYVTADGLSDELLKLIGTDGSTVTANL